MSEIDDRINALLDVEDPRNRLEIFARIHEHRRKRAHAEARAKQPKLGVSSGDGAMQELVKAARKPLDDLDRDAGPGALEYLCETVHDCLDAGDLEDTVFALVRVWRKVWAMQPHLGPIEREKKGGF